VGAVAVGAPKHMREVFDDRVYKFTVPMRLKGICIEPGAGVVTWNCFADRREWMLPLGGDSSHHKRCACVGAVVQL
jgi:hypothetical protein